MPKGPQKNIRNKRIDKIKVDKEKKKITIECLRLSSDGSGIGYHEGKATFASGLLPGELGEVEIYEEKKNWQRGILVSLLKKSEERISAPCDVFGICGGCQLQHLSYDKTLEWKRRWVEDALTRIGKVSLENVKVHPTIGMDEPWRYRNKARLHRGAGGELGYYREKSKDIVRFSDCLLISEQMNKWIREVEEILKSGLFQEVKTVTFRENSQGGGVVILEPISEVKERSHKEQSNEDRKFNGMDVKKVEYLGDIEKAFATLEGIKAVWGVDKKGKPGLLYGEHDFREEILGLNYKVSPLAFLQVNPVQTCKLYSKALEWAEVSDDQVVWDLYSGIGTITLALAQKAKKVIGIEENPFAVEDAKVNAEINKMSYVKFLAGKVEDTITDISERPDVVVMDPPRAGAQREVLDRLIELKPERIVYVSCDPGTLARDLGILETGGFVVREVQPVDMFGWSHHVECVTLMSRVEK